ncbi:MAG TPA: hypothetical protein VMB50_16950 [Myxococcales bacterium]|nr:hypothetical protein [Myxococcales bacterium]
MGTNTKVGATPSKYQASIQKLMAGFSTAFPAKSTLTVNGTALSVAQITAKLQAIVDEYQAILDARSTLQGDLQTAKTNRPTEHALIMQLHGALVSFFGAGSSQLLQFGFTPTKPKQAKTAAQKATIAAKAKATRALRHTMGSVQKQSVKYGASSTSVTIVNGQATIASPSGAEGDAASAPQSSAAASGTPAVSAPSVPVPSGTGAAGNGNTTTGSGS